MFGNMTDSAREAMTIATAESQRFNQFYLGTEHLFIGLCKVDDPELSKAFLETGFDPIYWRRKIRASISIVGTSTSGQIFPTPRCEKVMKLAERVALKQESENVTPRHLFLALLAEGEGIPVRLMRSNGFDIERLIRVTARRNESVQPPTPRSTHEYTFLKKIGRDLTELAREGKLPPTVGRTAEMLKLAQALRKKVKGNVLIIGDAGTGKSSIVYGFAQRIVADDANQAIKNIILFEISMSSLIAGTKFRGSFEENIQELIREASSSPNIVLFLDEFHLVKGAGSSNDSMDVANLLKPALASGIIKCIGSTTTEEYRRFIEKDEALTRRFEILQIPEPTKNETTAILEGLQATFEAHHGVKITQEAIESTSKLAEKYLPDRKFPDKAIDLLDRTCANAVLESIHARDAQIELPEITSHSLMKTIELMTGIVIEEDSRKLRNLESRLREAVIGQDEAIATITRTIRVRSAGLSSRDRPIGSFLLVGPTGVGKTEMARALAIHYFGSERNLIRFDMSEYAEPHTISRLLGSPPGYVGSEDEGQFSKRVRSNPHSVVLFDEVDKAHPDVWKILLQILEPGEITDNHGRIIRFTDAVVIITSNVGSNLFGEIRIGGNLRPRNEVQNISKRVITEVGKAFSPELLNRLDSTVVFQPLEDKAVLYAIIDKFLREIRVLLQERGMEMIPDLDALDMLLAQGYNSRYGARDLKRTIDRLVREPLSLCLYAGDFGRGDVVRIVLTDGQLGFEKA